MLHRDLEEASLPIRFPHLSSPPQGFENLGVTFKDSLRLIGFQSIAALKIDLSVHDRSVMFVCFVFYRLSLMNGFEKIQICDVK